MMLFEAMPLTLHSNKRKNPRYQEEVPQPKRNASQNQSVAKSGRSSQNLRLTKNLGESPREVTNGVCASPVISSVESTSQGRRKASLNAELALRLHYHDGASNVQSGAKLDSGMVKVSDVPVMNGGKKEQVVLEEVGVSKDTVVSSLQELTESNTLQQSAGEKLADGGPISRSLKRPTLMLSDLKKQSPKDKCSPNRTEDDSFRKSFYESGNYVRRMASLNASACVAAMIEPDKRARAQRNNSLNEEKSDDSGTSASTSPGDDFPSYAGCVQSSSVPQQPAPETLTFQMTSPNPSCSYHVTR